MSELLSVRNLESTPYYSIPTRPLVQLDLEKISAIGNMPIAFWNHEGKALTLLALGIEDDVTKHRLRSSLVRATGYAWDIHADSVQNYCRTLNRFGGFTESYKPDSNLERWRITQAGVDALPIDAYLLLESYRYSIPLTFAFGASISANDRHAPINRLMILTDMVLKEGAVTIANIVKDTGLKYTTADVNILCLKKLELINHDSLTPENGKGQIKFWVTKYVESGKLPVFKGKSQYLVKDIYGIIRRANIPMSIDDVVAVIEKDDSLDPRLGRLRSLRQVVNNVLGALRGKGILESNWTAVTNQSQISFRNDNNLRGFIEEIVPGIVSYLDDDHEIRRKFDLARSFLMSECEEAQLVREFLMNRARLTSFWSPNQLKVASDTVNQVYQFLLENPDSRIADIAQAVRASDPEAKYALYTLMQEQKATRIRKGRGSYYSAFTLKI